MNVERPFVSLDREAFAVATRRLGYSLVGLVLGVGLLSLSAVMSGAFPLPGPASPPVDTPLAGPLLGGAAAQTAAPIAVPAIAVVPAAPPSVAVAAATQAAAPVVAAAPASPAVVAPPGSAPRVELATYRYSGRRYTGLTIEPGTVVLAASAAAVQVRTYQLVDGDVRVGSNVPWLPFFAYVTLITAEGKLTYRPGALRADTALLVEDGDEVAAGAPLFRVVGGGASSWGTFYDASAPYNVVVSLVAVPSGVDLDAAPLIATR